MAPGFESLCSSCMLLTAWPNFPSAIPIRRFAKLPPQAQTKRLVRLGGILELSQHTFLLWISLPSQTLPS